MTKRKAIRKDHLESPTRGEKTLNTTVEELVARALELVRRHGYHGLEMYDRAEVSMADHLTIPMTSVEHYGILGARMIVRIRRRDYIAETLRSLEIAPLRTGTRDD